MVVYAAIVFTSAMLLFQAELLIAKYILPWFGGTPTVWSVCMLFFQVVLIGGYAYSHGLVTRLAPSRQSRVHLVLLSISIAALVLQLVFWGSPLLPGPQWKPSGSDLPSLRVLALLAASIALPFFTLSTTTSLVQAWFGRRFPGRSPYVLFAVSNAGSLFGLLSYPFLVEPHLGLKSQAAVWSLLFLVFALCCGFAALVVGRKSPDTTAGPAIADRAAQDASRPPTWSRRVLWMALAAGASTLLLATTNQLAEDVAVIPFMWAIPLAIYLLTFILTFAGRPLYWRPLFVVLGLVAMYLVGSAIAQGASSGLGILRQMAVYYLALLASCMLCHGELARLKPGVRYLTSYYLYVAIGGAVGGIFVGLVAPLVFRGFWELYLGYFLCGLTVLVAAWGDGRSLLNRRFWKWPLRVQATTLVILLAVSPFFLLGNRLPQEYRSIIVAVVEQLRLEDYLPAINSESRVTVTRRNFYGILLVKEMDWTDPEQHRIQLSHGQTIHGSQFVGDDLHRREVTTYYGETSGIAKAIVSHPRYRAPDPGTAGFRVGMIGLGAGTLTAYGRKGDYYRIYEIDPDVVDLAASDNACFSFVRDSQATVEVVLGDARISLEREEPQQFDVLALDAFSGDSIPVHLLTTEAFAVYLRHMREGGIIACHVSNRYLDLKPLVWKLAAASGLDVRCVDAGGDGRRVLASDWMILSRDKEVFQQPAFAGLADQPPEGTDLQRVRLWTDDYSNLYQLLRKP